MKKLALTSLIAMFAFTGAHAATNYFVGGAARLTTDDDHATVLSVAPEVGYKYNANWDLGVFANFGYDHKDTVYVPKYAITADVSTYTYGAGAFARYKVAQMGGVKLLLKGSVGVGFTTYDPEISGQDSETLTTINAAVIPMVTYDVSPAFTLYANLNFLGVNAGYNFKNDDMGIDSSWNVRAAADSNNVANTGAFQIGFNYNF